MLRVYCFAVIRIQGMFMQQAYRALRIVAESQTIRIVLAPEPDELMLNELCIACDSLRTEGSSGIKAVVLDFNPTAAQLIRHGSHQIATDRAQTIVESARAAVRAISQPVLAVARATLSQTACMLIQVADFTLVAEYAVLTVSNEQAGEEDTLTGSQAARLGYVTWSAPANDISKHMQRILDLLRAKSAIALRHAKAGVRLAEADHATRLEALQQVNTLYLTQLMQTQDAREGLRAFLEKRKPNWKNL
jgi:enoyl-CoA hydratase/isomerase-like protein